MSLIKKKLNKNLTFAAIFVSIIGVIISLILVCKHSGNCTSTFGCTINGVDGCSELGSSKYSKINFPFASIPIAILGFFYYSLIGLLLFNLNKIKEVFYNSTLSLLTSLVVFGFIFDLFLAYRNFFVLTTPCLLCVYTYICQILLLGIILWLYFDPDTAHHRSSKNHLNASIVELIKVNKISFIASIVLASFVFFIFHIYLSSKSNADKLVQNPNSNLNILPKSEVNQVLKEFRSLKKIEIAYESIKTYEGDESAYIIIQDWYDFRCPHCRHLSELLQEAMIRWPGRIKLIYRQFPLDGTCNSAVKQKQVDGASCKAALASICSSKDNESFVKMYHGLFNFQITQTHIDNITLAKLVSEVGGSWNQIESCMNSPSTYALLHKDLQEGEKINLSATPTVTINNFLLPAGSPDKIWFFRLLDALVLEKEGDEAILDFNNRASYPSN